MLDVASLVLDFDSASFYLRDIKDIAKQGHHRVSRLRDKLDLLPLIITKVRGEKQFCKAKNCIHWSANFVAHIGKKL